MTELPPIEWFRSPGLTEPTPVTIEASGRVYGHIAAWDAQHTAFPGKNVRPPHSRSDYQHFHVGGAEVIDDTGNPAEISVGRLTMNTGHAPLTSDAGDSASFYDNTGSIAALVCAGEDQAGVWFAGAIEPDLDEVSRRRFRASAISGDWRSVNGGPLELIAALAVPTPGFNIPRARVASAEELAPMVAAGMIPNPTEEPIVAAPTPPQSTDGPSADGTVAIGDTGLVGRVVEQSESGDVVVEVTVPSSELHSASEEQAVAASAKLTQRQQMRSLQASLDAVREDLAARDRADEAARLLRSVPADQ